MTKKNMSIALVIFIVALVILKFVTDKTIYFTQNEIYNVQNGTESDYYGNLSYTDKPFEQTKVRDKIYTLPKVNYQISDLNEEYNNSVYNIFKITELEPLKEYSFTVSFNYDSNVSKDYQITVGFFDYEPESNITLTNESQSNINFSEEDYAENKAKDYYVFPGSNTVTLELNGVTNENGEVWLAIETPAVTIDGNTMINYNLGQVKVEQNGRTDN